MGRRVSLNSLFVLITQETTSYIVSQRFTKQRFYVALTLELFCFFRCGLWFLFGFCRGFFTLEAYLHFFLFFGCRFDFACLWLLLPVFALLAASHSNAWVRVISSACVPFGTLHELRRVQHRDQTVLITI